MSKDSLAKCYRDNKDYKKKNYEKYQRLSEEKMKKCDNMGTNDMKISLKMKKNLLNYRKTCQVQEIFCSENYFFH